MFSAITFSPYWYHILYTQKLLHNKGEARPDNGKRIPKPKTVKFMLILPLLWEFRFPFFNTLTFWESFNPCHFLYFWYLFGKVQWIVYYRLIVATYLLHLCFIFEWEGGQFQKACVVYNRSSQFLFVAYIRNTYEPNVFAPPHV